MTDTGLVLAKLSVLREHAGRMERRRPAPFALGVIEPALARRMADTSSLRNRIAHGYGSVDFERLWREAPGGVEALRAFAASIARFIGS